MQNYIRPMSTMLRQIERLLENYAGDKAKQENLKAINKKMVCIYKLLHQQTSQPPNLQQSLEVLDAAERQIKHWLQQLQIKDAKPAQPQQPQQPQQPPQPQQNAVAQPQQPGASWNPQQAAWQQQQQQQQMHPGQTQSPPAMHPQVAAGFALGPGGPGQAKPLSPAVRTTPSPPSITTPPAGVAKQPLPHATAESSAAPSAAAPLPPMAKPQKSTFQRFVETVKAMDSASPQVLQQAAHAFSTSLEHVTRGSCPASLFEANLPDVAEDAASGPFWFLEDGDAKLQRAAKRRRVQGGGSEKSEFPVLLTSHE